MGFFTTSVTGLKTVVTAIGAEGGCNVNGRQETEKAGCEQSATGCKPWERCKKRNFWSQRPEVNL